MAITQTATSCWVPSWDGDDRSDQDAGQGAHYSDRAKMPSFKDGTGRAAFHKGCGGVVMFALDGWCPSCQDEGLDDGDWEAREVVPRQLAACWEVTCDNPACGDELEDDEVGHLHFPSETGAREHAALEDWLISPEGVVTCSGCRLLPARLGGTR